MRGVPENIGQRDFSVVAFGDMEFGFSDVTFEMAVANHGDGDSYSWTAGGGEHTYKIERVARPKPTEGYYAFSVWLVEIKDNASQVTEALFIDCQSLRIYDFTGQRIRSQLVNSAFNLVLDLTQENDERMQLSPYQIMPGGRVAPNYDWRPE